MCDSKQQIDARTHAHTLTAVLKIYYVAMITVPHEALCISQSQRNEVILILQKTWNAFVYKWAVTWWHEINKFECRSISSWFFGHTKWNLHDRLTTHRYNNKSISITHHETVARTQIHSCVGCRCGRCEWTCCLYFITQKPANIHVSRFSFLSLSQFVRKFIHAAKKSEFT